MHFVSFCHYCFRQYYCNIWQKGESIGQYLINLLATHTHSWGSVSRLILCLPPLNKQKPGKAELLRSHGPWVLAILLLRWCLWLAFYSFHFNMHFICWKCLIDFMQIISISLPCCCVSSVVLLSHCKHSKTITK